MIIQQQPTWRQMQRQRQKYFWDDCPCCWNSCADCSQCTVAQPAQYLLTVSGITDSTCNCEYWNGEFILTNDCLIFPGGNTCRWSSPYQTVSDPCFAGCNNCARWQVVFGSTATELMADGNLMAAYTYSAVTDCDQTIVFNYFADSLACINWPATLTLTPL